MGKWRMAALLLCLTAGMTAGGSKIAAAEVTGPGAGLSGSHSGQTVRQEEAVLPKVPSQLADRDILSDPSLVSGADRILAVRGTGGSAVRAAYYQVSEGEWQLVFETDGVWGLYGCTDEKREGDKKTPCGVYGFNMAFGILDDPGCVLPYHKVTEGDYWVDDPESAHYNRMVNENETVKDWNSAEHLISISPYYNYALSLTYNEEAVPGRGSAIFLHCTAEGYPGSSGCICIPEPEMKTVMTSADERTRIVILPE